MKNIAEYIDFKKGIINELSSLGISELRECMKSIKDEADQANWIEYLRWEVEALDLAEILLTLKTMSWWTLAPIVMDLDIQILRLLLRRE
jgi:hypothetical protein